MSQLGFGTMQGLIRIYARRLTLTLQVSDNKKEKEKSYNPTTTITTNYYSAIKLYEVLSINMPLGVPATESTLTFTVKGPAFGIITVCLPVPSGAF